MKHSLILAITAASLHSNGASGAPRVADCHAISDISQRLSCYDAATGRREKETKQIQPAQPKDELKINSLELCDLKSIAAKLEKAIPEKSQFETTQEHAKKVEIGVAASGVDVNYVMCQATPPHLFRYNADTSRLELYALGASAYSDDVETGRYPAQNAFGSSAYVKQIRNERWELEAPRYSGDIKIPLTAGAAKEQMQDLRLGIVGALTPPYATKATEKSRPDLATPIEKTTTTHRLHFDPKAYVLFNDKTKSIIWSSRIAVCGSGFRAEQRLGAC